MWSDVLYRLRDQLSFGALLGRIEELGYGRQMATGEDVAANEVVGLAVGLVALSEVSLCACE